LREEKAITRRFSSWKGDRVVAREVCNALPKEDSAGLELANSATRGVVSKHRDGNEGAKNGGWDYWECKLQIAQTYLQAECMQVKVGL
jgi:hypothetical protein